MSIFRESSIGSFTRGGQTTLHYIRMVSQVIKQFFVVMIFVNGIIFAAMMFFRTTAYERDVVFSVWLAHFAIWMKHDPSHQIAFELEDGSMVNVKPSVLINNHGIKAMVAEVKREAVLSGYWCMGFNILFLVLGARFITTTGRDQADEEFVRGGALVPASDLKRLVLKKDDVGVATIGGVPIPKHSELAGILLCGGPGTGKSQSIMKMMSEFRSAGQRTIVYDNTGSFIEAFYNPETDIILNPLDARSKPWSVWADAEAVWEYENIAEALIPDRAQGNDPMWALAARKVFVEICKQLKREGRTTNQDLTDALMRLPKDALIEMLKNTEASSLLDKDAVKVIASVRIMMNSFTQCLTYLHDEGTPFSIRKWVADESRKGWIFVSTKTDQKTAIKPLITCWIDIASRAILSMTPDMDRRIRVVIDEVPTLNKLPSLLEMLTNVRKFGGAAVIGFQNYPQLCEIYDTEGANAICEACSTWVILGANGDTTGEWASKGLGKAEVNETSEGLSYGAHEIRDGVTLSKQRRTREIVMSAEITNLPNLRGYLRLGKGYPVGKIEIKYKKYKKVAKEFILREGASDIDVKTRMKMETVVRETVPEQADLGNESESVLSSAVVEKKKKEVPQDDMFTTL